VLLDEPFTGLDRELHDRLVLDVGRLLRETATPAVLVTHDRDEAAAITDRIVTLDRADP
jgi:thiamine transport system ATP-binding protein